jgi:molecular chaperone GrpE
VSRDQLTEDEELTEKAPDESAEVAEEASEPLTLEDQLVQAQAEAEEYLDGWQRARAELANYKKRVERERSEMHNTSRFHIVARFLDILDDLQRALENAPESLDGDEWFQGLTLIQRKLGGLLETEGVAEMDPAGQMFDPMLHEAISQEPSDEHEEGEIIEVLQKGYMLGERVVRPARVRVAG